MKRLYASFPVIFAVVMLVFALFLAWYVPSVSVRVFELEDISKSLETSHGRERKQQSEYDQAVAERPAVQEKLDQILPLLETAEQENKELKALRKELRAQKKALEDELNAAKEAGKDDAHE